MGEGLDYRTYGGVGAGGASLKGRGVSVDLSADDNFHPLVLICFSSIFSALMVLLQSNLHNILFEDSPVYSLVEFGQECCLVDL